jgi:hypothetical protein
MNESHPTKQRRRHTRRPSASATPAAGRTLCFGSSRCQLEVTITDEGKDRLVEGRVTPVEVAEDADAVMVVHERLLDARSSPIDRCGYFALARVPRGLGRLVVLTIDGRRMPSAWTVF